ncbi:plasmid pRiA4b ORF-3 family protein [Ornithinibacillus halotolerans]|uniref:Uncharacterized protein n=1 Tax=Ornithinibacillus halotolerans TaxID=1274357 RepID=A0A916RKA6_9BACI|nr:plasmid pRiA4b ORF-3 family protein [Ornithinibacillus halotolerans]GGA60537.1 hypothetical protein GCM10008025_00700 [Ornithinibacillus halotolerans]
MIIHCTKKLQDQLKLKPETVEEESPLISWHANLLIIDRKKTLVLVNDKNRYVLVLYGLLAKDFKNLDHLIVQAIRRTFQQEGIKEDVIEKYLETAGDFTYTKTSDRKLVARMNKACELVYSFADLIDVDSIEQPALGYRLSRFLVGDGKKDYFHPNKAMYEDLEELIGLPIFQTTAYELTITLQLQSNNVYRKVIVPANFSFARLHHVIQTAFGWQDEHLHEFYILSNEKTNNPYFKHNPVFAGGYKPLANLVSAEEAFEFRKSDIPMAMDDSVILSQFLPGKITYVYDYGDTWIHHIKVERILEDYDKNYATCTAGEGKTPPEDVGGEGGYEYLLEVLADKHHEDYKHMRVWSESQGYKDFNIEMVNRSLTYK